MSEMEYYWNNIKCWSESDKYEDSNLLIRLFKNIWINIVEFEKVNCYIILWVRYTLKILFCDWRCICKYANDIFNENKHKSYLEKFL